MTFARFLLFGAVGAALATASGLALQMLIESRPLPPKPDGDSVRSLPSPPPCPEAYKTARYGYDVCIPSGWHYREFDGGRSVGFDAVPLPEASALAGTLTITAHERASWLVLADVRRRLSDISEERITVAGVDATRVQGTLSQGLTPVAGQTQTVVIINHGRYTYEITYFDRNRATPLSPLDLLLATWRWTTITDPAPVQSASGALLVEQPVYEAIVTSPLTVKGRVTDLPASVRFRLLDARGTVLASGEARLESNPSGTASFALVTRFVRSNPPDPGTLEVTAASDDSQETVTFPIRFR